MRESSRAALGGIISAIAVVIMLCTYISPFLVYTAPPFAGLILLIIVNEIGYKWSVGAFFTISFLSIFLIADKESAVFFTMFFGYYPILAVFLENAVHNKILRFLIKLIIYNLSVTVSFIICTFVFGIEYDEFGTGKNIFIILFAVLMNILFTAYNLLVTKFQLIYLLKFHKRIETLFKR